MKNNKKEKEDFTKYGEFVSSLFRWISPENQKDRVDQLEKITKNREKKQKN